MDNEVVGAASRLWAGHPRCQSLILFREIKSLFLHNDQTGSEAHSVSKTMGTGFSFPGGKEVEA
jgi:hypothetical protein